MKSLASVASATTLELNSQPDRSAPPSRGGTKEKIRDTEWVARRGGWYRLWLLLILGIALVVGLSVGLTVGMRNK
jgi:hypothetical protein